MYTDDINNYLTNKYGDLSLASLNEKKLELASTLYQDDEVNLALGEALNPFDVEKLRALISKISEMEVFLEVLSRLNTVSEVEPLKVDLYDKYLKLLETLDEDLSLDTFEEILSYSFSSPLNGKEYFLLDLYDKMILTTFKDQDYTRFKAKAIKELRKANISKEVNAYLDKIIKHL